MQRKSKITVVGTIEGSKGEGFKIPFHLIGNVPRSVHNVDPDAEEPIRVEGGYLDNYWVFRRKILQVEGYRDLTDDELKVLVKHEILKREEGFARIRRQVEAFENLERLPSERRDRISESVRLFVWQRDGGKCVECGSKERLEFDHIIPVIEGGSSTERNLQLLCEPCNRKKGRKI